MVGGWADFWCNPLQVVVHFCLPTKWTCNKPLLHVCCPVLVVVRDSNFKRVEHSQVDYRGNKKSAGANFISAFKE